MSSNFGMVDMGEMRISFSCRISNPDSSNVQPVASSLYRPRIIIIIIIITTTFMRGIFNHILESNLISRVYSVAAVVYLQFV